MKRYLILLFFLISGTILFQGFQCASPEMTTAKLAFRNNDWPKVEEFAGKEIAKNPKNGEAKFLLSRAKIKLNKTEEAAKLILEAEKLPLEPEIKQQIPLTKFLIWTNAFNTGITHFNNYMSNQNKVLNDSAIYYFLIGQMIRPENAEFDSLIGRAYEEQANEVKAMESYLAYTNKLKNEPDWAKNVGVFIKNHMNKVLLDSAIYYFQIGQMIRPENAEFDRLIGRAYEEQANEEKAMESYLAYTKKLKNELDWAKNVGVFIKMPRKNLAAKIGKAMNVVGDKLGDDTVLTDTYSALGRPIYIYYSMDDKNEFIVEGWRVNPPAEWMENEKTSYLTLDVNPFAYLAQTYFNRAVAVRDNPKLDSVKRVAGINENLEKAKDYTKIITNIDPTNIDANRFLISLYEAQGKSDEALAEVSKLVQKEPDNKFYLAQYGELFLRLNKYDDAIEQYQKALKIDPEFCDVNRNIAAALKNKAVAIIQAQEDKKDRDKNFKENPDEYKPYLIQSADYFKKSRNCEKYKNDLQVLSELANLYYGLNNLGMNTKNDLNMIVDDLERLEHAIPDNDKEVYWLKMCKILSDMNSPKSARACQEAKKFLK